MSTDIQQKNESEIDDYEIVRRKINEAAADDSKSLNEHIREISTPVEIDYRQSPSTPMIDNPLNRDSILPVADNNSNADGQISLDVSENELAKKILSSKTFDLADAALDVQASTQSSLFITDSKNYKQTSLGNVNVIPKNTISLKDVNLSEIPQNIDIQLKPDIREVVLIGKEMSQNNTNHSTSEKIDEEMFIEKSFEDIQKQELHPLERMLVDIKFKESLRLFLKLFPLFMFWFFYVQASTELSECVKSINEIDEQSIKSLDVLRKK